VLLQRLLQLVQLPLLLLRRQPRRAELAPERRQLGAQDLGLAARASACQRCRRAGRRCSGGPLEL
jgi:hypothetical protein